MQIFELHFNPKAKEDYIFNTFAHEPENTFERKLGSLYLAGDLKNAIPRESKEFLADLSKVIKKGYYSSGAKEPEKALLEALKKANSFLENQVKEGYVNWLGNFNFAAISLKDTYLSFTISGGTKVILARKGEITDIGKDLNSKEIEPYPLKVFFNTASGRISDNDKVILATQDLAVFLKKQGFFEKISRCDSIDPREIKKILPPSLFEKGEEAEIPGLLLILNLAGEEKRKNPLEMFFEKKNQNVCASRFSIFSKKLKKWLREIRFRAPKIRIANPMIEKLVRHDGKKKKTILLLSSFFFLLLLGLLIFESASPKKTVEITNWGNIQELEVLIQLNAADLGFNPQKIAFYKGDSYAFSPNSSRLAKINLETKKKDIIETGGNIQAVDSNSETLFVLFSPNNLFYTQDGLLWKEKTLEKDSGANLFSSYLSNLYFLDRENCKVLKYSSNNSGWNPAQDWSLNNKEGCSDPKSIAVDGSVWILNKDNSLARYYGGKLQQKIPLGFPANKIEVRPGIPYIYFLNLEDKQIIITEKNGKPFKQFSGNQLQNLRDFTVSSDGKTLYILNGLDIYRLNI